MSALLLFRPSSGVVTPPATVTAERASFLEHTRNVFAEHKAAVHREHSTTTFEE